MSYQEKLRDLCDSASFRGCMITTNYHGFYIHSAFYDSKNIHKVYLGYGVEYYSTSYKQVEKRIRLFRKAFNL